MSSSRACIDYVVFWLSLVIMSCLAALVAAEALPTTMGSMAPASLIRLIASPDDFHGQRVQLKGFLVVDKRHEEWHVAIYLSRDDADYGVFANGLFVSFDEDYLRANKVTPEEFDHQFVLIEGRFDMNRHGPQPLWPGEVTRVTRLLRLVPAPATQPR